MSGECFLLTVPLLSNFFLEDAFRVLELSSTCVRKTKADLDSQCLVIESDTVSVSRPTNLRT